MDWQFFFRLSSLNVYSHSCMLWSDRLKSWWMDDYEPTTETFILLISFAEEPIRLKRDVVLLTDDRNLQLKAHLRNVPVRNVLGFMRWARISWEALMPTQWSWFKAVAREQSLIWEEIPAVQRRFRDACWKWWSHSFSLSSLHKWRLRLHEFWSWLLLTPQKIRYISLEIGCKFYNPIGSAYSIFRSAPVLEGWLY